jgi:hypothetical protein
MGRVEMTQFCGREPFVFSPLRRCRECNHAWEPRPPTFGCRLMIALSVLGVVLGSALGLAPLACMFPLVAGEVPHLGGQLYLLKAAVIGLSMGIFLAYSSGKACKRYVGFLKQASPGVKG